MQNKLIILLTGLLLPFFTVLGANKISLTIDEAVRLGLQHSKNLKIANSKVKLFSAKSDEADAQLLPSFKLTSGYTRLSEVQPFTVSFQGREIQISPIILNNYTIRLGLQYVLFSGFRLENTTKMLEFNTLAAKEDYAAEENNIVANIKIIYWSIKNTEALLASAIENIKQIKAHIQDLENFYRNGMATENDILKVKVQLSNVELTKLDIENAIKVKKINLAILLGLDPMTEIDLVSEIETSSQEFQTLPTLLELAYSNRPELKAMALRKEANRSSVSIARAGWLPQIIVGANYNYNRPNQRLMPAQDKFYGTWDFGITLSYDIWNWMTTKYQVQQAEENYRQTDFAYQQIKDGITLEVSQNYFALQKAKEKIETANVTIQQAKENYRITQEKFRNGLVSSTELLDAEIALLGAEISLNASYLEFQIAKINLDKSVYVK